MSIVQTTPFAWQSNLLGLFKTMRPHQWTKNIIIFAALVFDGKLFQPDLFLRTVLLVASFCFLSSAVYIMNDLVDIEKDRQHPVKCRRPLACGELKPAVGVAGAALLLATGLGLAVWVSPWVGAIGLLYVAQNIAYSFYLKNVVIIDVMVLSLGFLLRVVAGGLAVGVHQISPWLYVCATLVALFLGFGKRRHELMLLKENATNHRTSLGEYNLFLIDQIVAMVTTSIFITYTLYSFEASTTMVTDGRLLVTVPFVFYFIARYLYLIHVRHQGGAPDELLLKDKPLLVNTLLWAVTVVLLLYVL